MAKLLGHEIVSHEELATYKSEVESSIVKAIQVTQARADELEAKYEKVRRVTTQIMAVVCVVTLLVLWRTIQTL